MAVRLELGRLELLQEALGRDVPQIVAGIAANLERELGRIATALVGGELALVVKAAHACRNDTMLIGADELLAALTGLERAARSGDLPLTRRLHDGVLAAWPETRSAIRAVADGDGGGPRGQGGG